MKDLILKALREEVSNGKVTCDNCGWAWSLKEGGHDPYICHQCNHNNQPKKLNENSENFLDKTIYSAFESLLKKNGFNYDNVVRFAEVLNINNMNKYVHHYLDKNGIPGIYNRQNNILLACNKCGYSDLKFYFLIESIDVPSTNFQYDNQIDLYVYVSDRGSGEFELFNGETYKGSFYPIVYHETEANLYDELFFAVKDAITYYLDDKLENYGIKVNIDALDFTPVK